MSLLKRFLQSVLEARQVKEKFREAQEKCETIEQEVLKTLPLGCYFQSGKVILVRKNKVSVEEVVQDPEDVGNGESLPTTGSEESSCGDG